MSLILRKDLTRPLTHNELDSNFVYLNIKYWEKKSYESGEFVLRDVESGTVLYYCETTHTEYPYDAFNSGNFIADYIDGGTDLPVILWKMVGGTGTGAGTITGGTNLEGAPSQPTNTDTYTAIFKEVADNALTFKTLNSPDGSIVITNDNGTIYLSSNITPITAVNFSVVDTTGVTCYGGFSGAITVSASGGSHSYRFTKDGGLNWTDYYSGSTITHTFTGLRPGAYDMGVYDETMGAQPYITVTVTGNTQINLTNTSNTLPYTPGAPYGEMNFSISGGVEPYTYDFNGTTGTTSDTFNQSALVANSYPVTITDSLGCSESYTFDLGAVNLTMNSVTATRTNPTCSGGTGSIAVTVSNGSGFYNISLNSGTTYNPTPTSGRSFTITTGAGTYNLVVKDFYDNTTIFVGTYTITNPPQISLVSTTGSIGYCGAAPSVAVYVSGTTSIPKISLNSGVTYNNATFISGNTYVFQGSLPANTIGTTSFKYYDPSCATYTGTTSYSYTGYTAIGISGVTTTPPICSSDLWAYKFTLTGGTGSYDYKYNIGSWNSFTNGSTISVPTGLGYTNIQFRDTNYTSCTITPYAISSTPPTAISATSSITSPILCSGGTGSVNFALSGGITPYEYIILSGSTPSLTSGTTGTTSTSTTITGLRAGYYNLMVRSSGSTCSFVTGNTVQLTDPAAIYLSGVTYTSGSCGGNATVILTFTSTTTPFVTTSPAAAGGLTSSLGSNRYTVSRVFTPPINTSVAFSYYNSSCPYTGTTGATVVAPAGISSALNTATYTPKCPGEFWVYTPTVSGGVPPYEYQLGTNAWTGYTTGTPINITVTGSSMGTTTTLRFRDSVGCTGATLTPKNSIVTALSITTGGTAFACAVGSTAAITLNVTGGSVDDSSGFGTNGYQYLLFTGSTSTMTYTGSSYTNFGTNTPNTTFSTSNEGYYAFNVRRVGTTGCTTYIGPIARLKPTPVSGSVIGYTGVTSCETTNGMIQITVTGGTGSYEYRLDANPTWLTIPSLPFTITGQSATTHLIYIRDTNGCSATNSPLSVILTGVSSPTLTGSYTAPVCGAGNALITLNASGTPNYTYYSGVTSLITTSATTYSFYVTPYSGSNSFSVIDGAGCTNTISIVGLGTTTPMSAVATTSGSTLTVTLGGSSVPSYTYALYSGATVAGGSLITSYSSIPLTTYNITGLSAGGQYIVRVTDTNGCSADTASVTMPVTANLYYFWYNLNYVASGTSFGNYYNRSGGSNYITQTTSGGTYAYTPGGILTATGRTTNEVVNYYISTGVTSFGGGVVDLSTSVKSGGFGSGAQLQLNSTGVPYGGYMAILVPDIAPWTGASQDFTLTSLISYPTAGSTSYNTIHSIYTGGTLTINGLQYKLYNVNGTNTASGSTNITVNIK